MSTLAPFLDRLCANQSCVLIALGDSNTDNTRFAGAGKQRPELLHTELKQHYRTQRLLLVNAGVSGDTVLNALDRFDTDVAAFGPTLTRCASHRTTPRNSPTTNFATASIAAATASTPSGPQSFCAHPLRSWK